MTDIKTNNLYKKLGIGLIDNGIQFLRKSFNANAELKQYTFIKDSLNGVGLESVAVVDMDLKYKVCDWSVWQEILAIMNTIYQKIPYVEDYFDCDNYAYFTSSFCPLVFGVSCGEAFGKWSKNGKSWMHHWNLIIDKEGNVYIYDGTNKSSCQVVKGQPIVINGGTYEIQTVKFF